MTIVENCTLLEVLTNRNKEVIGVRTDKGDVECDAFVNAGGFWARNIGKLSEPHVKVPLHPCHHYYLHTKEVQGLDPHMPGRL